MELKVILYLTAGLAYFIYKQFRKLQEDAITRQAKLEDKRITNNSKNPKSIELIEELVGENVQRQKRQNLYSEQLSSIKKIKDIEIMETENPRSISKTIVRNENSNLDEFEYKQFNTSNANDIGFTQVRNMILFSELLKRPSY